MSCALESPPSAPAQPRPARFTMPKLNILVHKSYHPYLEKNKERVRRDEALEQARIEAEEQRSLQADAEARLALLRGQASRPVEDLPQSIASSSASSRPPEDPFYAAQPDGNRSDRKGKSRAKGDDMRALDRQLAGRGGSRDEGGSAARDSRGADDSLSFYGKDGHLNFWASEEMRPPTSLPDKKQRKTPEELEKEDPYTMYLSRPERELKPWYVDPGLRRLEDREGRDQAATRKREQRLRRDEEGKRSKDPFTHIQSLLSSSSSSRSATTASSSTPRLPPAATPMDKRLQREASERARALALVASHRRASSAAAGSEPSTPAVSMRSATPASSVRPGGWAEGGYAEHHSVNADGGAGYGESRFNPDALRRVEWEREQRRRRSYR